MLTDFMTCKFAFNTNCTQEYDKLSLLFLTAHSWKAFQWYFNMWMDWKSVISRKLQYFPNKHV